MIAGPLPAFTYVSNTLNAHAEPLPAITSICGMLTALAEPFPVTRVFLVSQLTLQDRKQPSQPLVGP